MNKKINYLSILPIYGTAILLFLMFIQMVKKQINKKWFSAFFISCSLFGFLSILILILFMNFLNSISDISNFISSYGMLVVFIAAGYLLNLYSFYIFNKYEYKFYKISKNEKLSFSINKKTILFLGCILAVIITFLGLILVFMLRNNLL